MPEHVAMLDQYRRIKARYRDMILFFRLGDFYEMFFEDAVEASGILDLTLTQRQGNPMCGIPYHAAKPYIARLLKAGKRVAICEQLGTPNRKGIVERDVVEVVTPGTTVEEDFLDHGSNNYLMSVYRVSDFTCLAYLDVSTGEFRAYSKKNPESEAAEMIRAELYRLSPRELIIQQSLYEVSEIREAIHEFDSIMVEKQPDWMFDVGKSSDEIKLRFGVSSLAGFGFSDEAPELAAAGMLLRYLDETAKLASPHIGALLPYDSDEYLGLDESTRRNLELIKNLSDSSERDTLFSVLDKTKTAGGIRLLRQWILQPLREKPLIEERLDAVEYLYRNQVVLTSLRSTLGKVLDTERLAARVAMDKAHAKDLLALSDSVAASIACLEINADVKSSILGSGLDAESRSTCEKAVAIIDKSIRDEPSILLTEGNLIKDGFDEELDHLRFMKKNSTQILEKYLEEEKNLSGIQSLRIRYNRIIGYYLEVTKGKLDSVPEHFIRRQSLVTGERYTTLRLAEIESEINGATESIIEREKSLFLEIRNGLKQFVIPMMELARNISVIDCVASFAQAATENAYCRPSLHPDPVLDIKQGRHPVVEMCLPFGSFIPNDLQLDGENCFALITGPNMAGKSTVLRQTALIVLMAHIGSFVPADEAEIGLTDKIFCRVGAQDNLARGQSTFLVEMHETAYILNTATLKSLVIMDEVGRGTGTLDGVSIAWAVSEYLLERIRCRTLFATHYHELTSIEDPHLRNMSMAVLESEGEIVFLKKLQSGAARGSYGLHVAKLAGIPNSVIVKAKELQTKFSNLEETLAREEDTKKVTTDRADHADISERAVERVELFSAEDLAVARIAGVDTDAITPLQALQLLSEIRKTLR
jgi:DNA mismatch repair protein MutS